MWYKYKNFEQTHAGTYKKTKRFRHGSPVKETIEHVRSSIDPGTQITLVVSTIISTEIKPKLRIQWRSQELPEGGGLITFFFLTSKIYCPGAVKYTELYAN